MAQEKEDFLGRWSRLKREQREQPSPEKTDIQEKPPQLPPVEQLTHESEFSGFMHPKVGDALRRVALRKLFSDPHFNTPDPFEPFSGDWTVGEPITDEVMAKLNQARTLIFSDEQKAQALAADEAQAEAEAYAEQERRDQLASEAKDDEPRRQDA
jgi:hypothetical protein